MLFLNAVVVGAFNSAIWGWGVAMRVALGMAGFLFVVIVGIALWSCGKGAALLAAITSIWVGLVIVAGASAGIGVGLLVRRLIGAPMKGNLLTIYARRP